MSIVNYEIANNVLDGIIGVHGTRRNYDSSTDERRCITLTPEDILKFDNIFKYNYGIMSDGKELRISDSVSYFKLPVNISMIDQESDILVDPVVSSIEELANRSCTSLQVFVDGYKLPDSEVKLYPTKTNVDVLIPKRYINYEHGSTVIIEKRLYNLYKYIHLYEKQTSQQSFVLDVDNNSLSKCKERNIQIYIDKKLYTSSRSVNILNNKLHVVISSEITDAEVEIIVDPYVMYFFPNQTLPYNNVPIYEIPESYIDSIHGPVSKFSCMFYLNGLRVANTDIDQKGRLHFVYNKLSQLSGGIVSFYLSDREKIVDTDTTLYGSDYYLYNFIGCDSITRALRTSVCGNRFIDAGVHKQINNLIVFHRLGTSTYTFSLPDNVVFKPYNDIKLYIGDDLVDSEDYTIEYNNPISLTVTNLSKYVPVNSSKSAHIVIESWFSWDEVLNNNGTLFSRQQVKEVIGMYNSGIDASTKVANILRNRPYLMRTFLSQYGYVKNYQYIEYDGLEPYMYIGVPDDIDSNNKKYNISINNKHIPSNEIVTLNKDFTHVFKIKGKYFNRGSNEIEIYVFDDNDCEYYRFTPEDVQNYDGINILKIKGKFNPNRLGDIENNIIILEKVDDSDQVVTNFPTDAHVGYKLNTRFVPYYDPDEDTLYITFDGGAPENEFLVYNKNFSLLYNYIKPTDSSITDVVIPLYMGTSLDPVPYICRGQIIVYADSERLAEGIDYLIKNEQSLESVGGSFLIFKRAILPGTSIDIYFTNIKTNVLFNKTGLFLNNRYGLFYLDSLKFPFSLNYMNIYLNGQKLSENDVDILSDKLIRVHSLPTPLYDLSIESAFTVDYSELEPYINEYEEDNFEKYLAYLFRNVDYSKILLTDSGEDVNEIYNSFIDTVDSVNKRPNPESRSAVWIPSYLDEDDDSVIGPHSNGSVVLGNNINASLIVGDIFIVGADNGKIASCILGNDECVWFPCNFEDLHGYSTEAIYSNGTHCNNEDITAITSFKGYILFGTREGHIYAYDPTNNVWKTNIETFKVINNTEWPTGVSINGFLVDDINDTLYVYGGNGVVDSYSLDNNRWHDVQITNAMGDIHFAFFTYENGHRTLVVLGKEGKVASCYIEYNTWIKPNGEYLNSGTAFPSIHSDGSFRDNKDIYSAVLYNERDYVLFGEYGVISYYLDNTHEFKNIDDFEISNSSGLITNGENINAAVGFEHDFIVVGCDKGYIAQYVSEFRRWNIYNSKIGITDIGINMEGNAIRTMQITNQQTHYIIFAGDNGKIASYNMDVDNVPLRYDPYKTVFLRWYNTPGNAIIQSVWDIPRQIEAMFDMYKENNETGDICIRGGDTDVMLDIDMNDNEQYPWNVSSRKRFVANFIKSLPEGRYTPDEIDELYRNSEAANMLYVEDVESIVFASGDEIDSDEDIDITTIT